MDKVGLDNNAVHKSDMAVSELIYKLILLFFGREGVFGDILDLFKIVILEILHQLTLLFEEPEPERIVSLNQKLVCFINGVVIYFFRDRDRCEYVYNSLVE